MLFNQIIDASGIEGVASKTNISVINLRFLEEENFEKLNRVKALGFLLILEREYKEIDVSGLRDKIKVYYDEHRPSDNQVVMRAKDSVEGGFSFFKIFIMFALLGGGYYLYSEGKLDALIQQIEDKKDFFDDKKALENNVSDEDASKVVVGKSEKESVEIETPVAPKAETIVLNDKLLDTKENSVDDATLKAVQSALAMPSVPRDENKTVEAIVKEVSDEFLANEQNISVVIMDNEPKVDDELTITTVNVNPTRGRLWFGFINLDNKKRREFMKESSTSFNINNSRWVLVTGHGFLDIVSNDKTLEIADNKKHYFYIDSTEVKEIDKKEFRELNGRRGW